MLVLLAFLPLFIVLVPLLVLIVSTKDFDVRQGAICDLNNFQKSRTKFIVVLTLFYICQGVYIITISTKYLPLIVLALVIGIFGLPFSSHSKIHQIPTAVGNALIILTMLFLSSSLHLTLIILFMALLGLVVTYRMIVHKRFLFWILEFIILTSYGAWNLSLLFLQRL
ncbi:MAG: hypothetical protein UW69_C0020G0003 [Microgenomates group bacterium GW2011_GWA2_44_7]|uniref:Uncharacterized protein n=1 Tax=Candidatus Woesebacteria bacterium GW2011_GWA1_41_13b TaxID=1618555 RepID=A0A0G0US88_9BACT|nr:MAG: hypothetical protein UU42_C0009G0011 [Candidatus Woesebacteria bacterium GW2011_GWA1_41_13b]KKT75120.1 MAG: hypothetical protein UW69_C0020G0003 [Microgenomates group bacterium GW2011_GWA2_44_7]KKT77186.1 MAG: hypothetical protein UW73_C0026G0011 [Microgenomates group bacterium GW2011_GWB1_44_8]